MSIKQPPRENLLWAHTAVAAPTSSALQGETQANGVIIGPGYTGFSSALHRAKKDVKVAVFEAAQIG